METKVVSFEQMPELIQNQVERIEALEKTVREKQQPQPLNHSEYIPACTIAQKQYPRHP